MTFHYPIVSQDSVEIYLKEINEYPILSESEEKELATRFCENKDLEAAKQLVLSHLRFVVHIAKGYTGYGLSISDLIQEGNIGLMKAVKRFNPERGVRLMSFAVHWIKAEIYEFVLKNWRIVKVATTKAQRKLFFNLRSHKTSDTQNWLTQTEIKSISQTLNVSEKEVAEMESRLSSHDMSLYLPSSGDEDSELEIIQIEDMNSDFAKNMVEKNWNDNIQQQLYLSLHTLNERERDIIEKRWLQDNKATLHELADKYEISAERVRQIEENAMKKLKKEIGYDL